VNEPPRTFKFVKRPNELEPIPAPSDPDAVIDPPLMKRFSRVDTPEDSAYPPPIPAAWEPMALIFPSRMDILRTREVPF
jgi:hypothetical protein